MGLIQSAGLIKDVGSVTPSLYGGIGYAMPRYKSGNKYLVKGSGQSVATTSTYSAGTATRWHPFIIDQPVTISAIGVKLVTVVASSACEFAIYGVDTNGYPTGSPLIQSTSLATTTAGDIDYTVSHTFAAGVYWIAHQSNTAGTAFTGFSAVNMFVAQMIGGATETNIATPQVVYNQTSQTYGTFPTGTITLIESPLTTAFVAIPHFTVA